MQHQRLHWNWTWLLLMAMAVLVSGPWCRAEVIVEDTFDIGAPPTRADDPDDPLDIAWWAINGLSSGGRQRPVLQVRDDAMGLGSGNALYIDSFAANSEFVGLFPTPVELGANVGDKLVISFDVRLDDAVMPVPPEVWTFRFGIFGDTDAQLGVASTDNAGSPTTWGSTDGWFDTCANNDGVGTCGDHGYQNRIVVFQGGGSGDLAQIHEEQNANDILGGTGDTDFVAKPAAGTFPSLEDTIKHTVTFTLERTVPNEAGESVQVTLALDGMSFSGQDGAGAINNLPSPTSFNYFVAQMPIDLNYAIDNFKVETLAGAGG